VVRWSGTEEESGTVDEGDDGITFGGWYAMRIS